MKRIINALVLLLLLAGCAGKNTEKQTAAAAPAPAADEQTITLTPIQMKNAGVAIGGVVPREIATVLRVSGVIDVPPQNMVSISVPMGGYLKNTRLLPGMHINKGDILAVVEDQQYIQLQQDYLTAKARIGYFENDYQRQKALNQQKAASDKVYQQAEADYNAQKVLIGALAQKLQLVGINVAHLNEKTISRSINVLSPIKGYVSKVNVNIGKYVSPTDVLFELIDPEDIHLAIKVFERDVNKLYIGQIIDAYTNSNTTQKHKCEVLLIGKDIGADRTVNVHCHFHDYDKSLIPGTYMNAEVNVKSKETPALPEDAIVRYEGKQYVFVAAGNQFTLTPVTTGASHDGYTAIADDSKLPADKIVVKGAYNLLMTLKNKSDE